MRDRIPGRPVPVGRTQATARNPVDLILTCLGIPYRRRQVWKSRTTTVDSQRSS
jgi:hypothetical protein